jgi:hypothetical protein
MQLRLKPLKVAAKPLRKQSELRASAEGDELNTGEA